MLVRNLIISYEHTQTDFAINRFPYNLYCIGGDVKHCTIQSKP